MTIIPECQYFSTVGKRPVKSIISSSSFFFFFFNLNLINSEPKIPGGCILQTVYWAHGMCRVFVLDAEGQDPCQANKTQSSCPHRSQSLVHYSGSFFIQKSIFYMKYYLHYTAMAVIGRDPCTLAVYKPLYEY